ncbi:MAG: hypothetical protein ACHQYP_07150 [Nitrospiria bacterium]
MKPVPKIKHRLFCFLVILLFPSLAWGYEGLSGSTWGQVSYDDDNMVGSGTMGYINQGIDWITLPGGIKFNTFGEVRYRFRSENTLYYNAYGEALGLDFKKSIFHFGADFLWETYPDLQERSNKVQYYLTWFYDWDLKKAKTGRLKGFPGSFWGQMTQDVDSLVGTGTMGYLNQGVDWINLQGGGTINSFAEIRWRFRSENRDYYDAYSEALGVELRKSPFHLGIDYLWEKYPSLNEYSDKYQVYLTWYTDWNLKPK